MSDRVDAKTRSKIMRSIRGKDTEPERILRKALWEMNYRYRKDYSIGRYRIDIAFPSRRVAIMVDGCFWHGCPIHLRLPKSNKRYWIPKIRRNAQRDKRITKELEESDWAVVRFWEHDIHNDLESCVLKIRKLLNGAQRTS